METEGARKGESLPSCSLLPSMGLLNHPEVVGSSGHVVSGDQVDSPAGTVPSGAELDLAVMDLLLSVRRMQ